MGYLLQALFQDFPSHERLLNNMKCTICHEQRSSVMYQKSGYVIKPVASPFLMRYRDGTEKPGHSLSGMRKYDAVCSKCITAIDNTTA